MNGTATGPLLQMIRRIIEDQRIKGLPDRELLRLFSEERDEAAFHGLLRRHGKMVFSVCRQFLCDEAAAEDAFQTTFLELARKAGTIRNTSSVGSWLYGVAYRTALKSRAELARRNRHERQKASESAWTSSDAPGRREIEEIVHAELSRFSECYRAPLVLCYLEGKTQDQAALVLGISKGSLKKQLERGRELLRARLTRRGVGTAGILLGSAWPGATASALVPPALVAATLKNAVSLAAGCSATGLISSNLFALMERAISAMFFTKLRVALVVSLALGVVPIISRLVFQSGNESAGNVVKIGPLEGSAARAVQVANDGQAPTVETKAEDPFNGEWTKIDTKESGVIRLHFGEDVTGLPGRKSLRIVWMPPAEVGVDKRAKGPENKDLEKKILQLKMEIQSANQVVKHATNRPGKEQDLDKIKEIQEAKITLDAKSLELKNLMRLANSLQNNKLGSGSGAGGIGGAEGGIASPEMLTGAPRATIAPYSIAEKEGKKILVLKMRNKDDFEVPYKFEDGMLILDGGIFQIGGQGGRPSFLKVELKGKWKRLDMGLENKMLKAFSSIPMEWEDFAIKLDLRSKRMIIFAHSMTLRDGGRVRFENCRLMRYEDAEHGVMPTTIASRYADFTFDSPVRSLADLTSAKWVRVDFADGLSMNLKEK